MEVYRSFLLTALRKYTRLYDGSLGEAVITEHVIDLTKGAPPVLQLPCRTGPVAREVVKNEVDKMT